jgi:capsule polysaccharide export protein KpsC/LpsZ
MERFPSLPENIHLLPADAEVNTYDLVDIAEVGLVFTTTVGMEMAMVGMPVIVSGKTHYREKGFTVDARSWEEYFSSLDRVLNAPKKHRLSREQVERAWTYAYRFFFEYPQPFPWHVQHFWKDESKWPLKKVLSEDGIRMFGDTFRYLTGEPITWG